MAKGKGGETVRGRFSIPAGFVVAIFLGAFLLAMPCSNTGGCWMPAMDALFTSCSAVCITGLTVINPGTDLTVFGQSVLLLLVQVGCVGIMTLGTFVLVVVGRRISLHEEFTLSDAYGAAGVKGLKGLIIWVVSSLLAIEAIGTVVLRYTLPEGLLAEGGEWFRAYFYSVMAFCNAGFSRDAGSLMMVAESRPAIFVMGTLIILGGLGFMALYNICTIKFWQRSLVQRGRLSLHTRVVLRLTMYLTLAAFVLFVAVEWVGTLSKMVAGDRLAVAFFHSVTPRTAGFTVVPLESLHPATRFIDGVLMFIGAGPGSAGGGIKMTTFFVLICTLSAIYHGRKDVIVHKRTLPIDIIRESIVITFLYAAALAVATAVLLVSEIGREGLDFERILFEATSAITTTGLSIGDTTQRLSTFGRCVLMVCMFAGRLGALTIVLLVAGREDPQSVRYPKEEIVVG